MEYRCPLPSALARRWAAMVGNPHLLQPLGGEEGRRSWNKPVLYLPIYLSPATHLFILNSNVFSSGRHKEGKKVKLIRGPFQVGSQPPAASGERLLSDLLPECGCPGASAEHLLRCSPYQAGHLRPLPHQGKAAHCFKVTTALCNWKHACLQSINLAVCSTGQSGQASWLNSWAEMPWSAECPGSNPGFGTNKLSDLGQVCASL